jgi:hypothetical protein
LVAVNEQLPLALITDTVVPANEQPVEDPTSKVRVPVPLPPDAFAVPVEPKVIELGAVTVSVACAALWRLTRYSTLAVESR